VDPAPVEAPPPSFDLLVAEALRRVSWVEQPHLADLDGAWQAVSPGLRTYFTPDEVAFVPVGESDPSWQVRLTLAGIGRGEHWATPQPAILDASGTDITYDRGPVTEFYKNTAAGLEQGFVLRERPSGAGAARVRMGLTGDLIHAPSGDGRVRFVDGDRRDRLEVSALHVVDASDRVLASWMEVEGCASVGAPCALSLAFDDRDATYPVTIDPLYTAEEAVQTFADGPGLGGYSVDVDGDWAIVGVPGPAGGPDDGVAVMLTRGGDTWNVVGTDLTDPAAGFGQSTALSFPYAYVGAPDANQVFVYEYEGGVWVHAQTLDPGGASFGTSLSADAAYLAVGDPGDQKVHLYGRTAAGAYWAFSEVVDPPGSGHAVGAAVSLSGTRLAVGAPAEDIDGSGEVYLYDLALVVSNGGQTAGNVTGDSPATTLSGEPTFGSAVALDGTWLAVGHPGGEAVHVHQRDDQGAWPEVQVIANLEPGMDFGHALALHGDTLAVVDQPALGETEAQVHVYERGLQDAGTFDLTASHDVGVSAGALSHGVAVTGDLVMVGSPEAAPDGEVHVFRREADDWSELELYSAAEPGGANKVGRSIALGHRFAAVGVPRDLASWGGTVLIFERDEGTPDGWGLHTTLRPSAVDGLTTEDADFGWSVALAGDTLIVGAPKDEGDVGAAFVYDFDGATWGLVHLHKPSILQVGGKFGQSVATDGAYFVVGAPGNGTARVIRRSAVVVDDFLYNTVGELHYPAEFGKAVAVDNGLVVIGAPGDANSPGEVYLYREVATGDFDPVGSGLIGTENGDAFGHALALQDNHLAVGAYGWSAEAGRACLFTSDGLDFVETACIDGAVAGERLGAGVALDGQNLYVGAIGAGRVQWHTQNTGGPSLWGKKQDLVSPRQPGGDEDYTGNYGIALSASNGRLAIGAPDENTEGVAYLIRPEHAFPPTARPDQYYVSEDQVLVVDGFGVLANDSDANGDPLTVTAVVSGPDEGTLEWSPDGGFTYTPAPDFFGDDAFVYEAFDGTQSAQTTVTVTVAAVNDDPVAIEDVYNVDEDTQLSEDSAGGLLANDTDVETAPGSLTVALIQGPYPGGTLTLYEDGSFEFLGAQDFWGEVTFSYQAIDDDPVDVGRSAETWVTITVNSVPDPPVAADQFLPLDEDTVLNAPVGQLFVGATDPDAVGEQAALVDAPAQGVVQVYGSGAFTYTPPSDWAGDASFTYQIGDGATWSGPATVTLTVAAANDAPVGVPDAYVGYQDEPLNVSTATGVLANDIDIDLPGDSLTVTVDGAPLYGLLSLAEDGSFVYTPDPGFSGEDSFTYDVSDGSESDGPIPVSLTLRSVNDPPTAVDDNYTLADDPLLQVDAADGVLANDVDPDGDPLVAIVSEGTADGELVLDGDGSFTYRPDAGFAGDDVFTYVVTDGTLFSAPATVTVVVVESVNPTDTDVSDTACVPVGYVDNDGDGFGGEAATSCGDGVAVVEVGGDCDDADANTYPDAPEISGDGVDQSCGGGDAVVVPIGACAQVPDPRGAAWLVLLAGLGIARRGGRR